MITRLCAHCGEQFSTHPCEIRKGHAKYCSKSCATSHRWESWKRDDPEHFWSRVAIGRADECWEWTGSRSHGYGQLRWNGRGMKAHRVALALTDGDWNSGLDVCHTCDNPPCCNPSHLWRGTAKQNVQDSHAKGRNNQPKGERHRCAKLTETDIRLIRASPDIQIVLAARYGVRQGVISAIRLRKTWKHIP